MNDQPDNIVPTRPIIKLDFSKFSEGTAGTTIAALFTALSFEIMSGDLLYLAFTNALNIAADNGVPPEEAGELLAQISAVMEAGRRRNPMSKMF